MKPEKKKYKDLWLAWLKTHPICSCGCGEPIIITYHGFRASLLSSGGPPKYVYPHFYLGKKKYWKNYIDWLNTKPVCACGCKKSLKIKYDTFARIFRNTGRLPIFYRDHKSKVLEEKIDWRNKEPIESLPKLKKEESNRNQKMCTLVKTMEGRCTLYNKCPLASKCLTIVAERKWGGWKSEKYG